MLAFQFRAPHSRSRETDLPDLVNLKAFSLPFLWLVQLSWTSWRNRRLVVEEPQPEVNVTIKSLLRFQPVKANILRGPSPPMLALLEELPGFYHIAAVPEESSAHTHISIWSQLLDLNRGETAMRAGCKNETLWRTRQVQTSGLCHHWQSRDLRNGLFFLSFAELTYLLSSACTHRHSFS